VLETCERAKAKNLTIVSGLCWRYDEGMRQTFAALHEGLAGDITALQCSYNSNGVWDPRVTREQCQSDMEYQMRNWYYYTWLSGDFNVEQHVHSLDKIVWAMKDQAPLSASGSGGRQQRTDPKYGNIYDHFNIVYEYPQGVKAFARCRHFRGCANDVSDHIFGTKGRVDVFGHKIFDYAGTKLWEYRGKRSNMYQQEHDEMFAAIRSGKPINNGRYMTVSTMMAILGRMVAYTGRQLTWDEAWNSKEDLTPAYTWGDLPVAPVAVPGVTAFV
jgi:predicted dehydrogenase